MQRIIIFGGSFNPVHIGHLRLAIEAKEALGADRADFVPCFIPPHKTEQNLLPFELRVKALKLAIKEIDNNEWMIVNEFESGSTEPSYTLHTLEHYQQKYPEAELIFVLGLVDFAVLNSWHKWQKLTELANFAVVPRSGHEEEDFINIAKKFWPHCCLLKQSKAQLTLLSHKNLCAAGKTGKLIFLPLPRLDISSSLLRQKWQAGQSLDFLLPKNVLNLLIEHRVELDNYWRF